MVHRRAVITGTVLGGALSALTNPTEAAGLQPAAQTSDRLIEDVANAIRTVRNEIERQYTFWEIGAVRDQLRTAALAKDDAAIERAAATMTGTCEACHKRHRDELPDRSYEIRL